MMLDTHPNLWHTGFTMTNDDTTPVTIAPSIFDLARDRGVRTAFTVARDIAKLTPQAALGLTAEVCWFLSPVGRESLLGLDPCQFERAIKATAQPRKV